MKQFVINNWYLFVALVVVLALLAYDLLKFRLLGIQTAPPGRAVQLMNHESAVIIDVGEPSEFKAGHIPGAMNVPVGSLQDSVDKLGKYKEKPVLLCCRSGNRSAKGAMVLKRHGFANVYNLSGGMSAWQKENLPLEK
jgi:rhodanese-related sulfurtransferase